jgi:hypothetical protein
MRLVKRSRAEFHPVPKPRRRIERGFRAWLRTQRCCVPGCRSSVAVRVHAAHVRSRGAGGADANNLVPFCAVHHAEQHMIGTAAFEARVGVTLTHEAKKYWRAWRIVLVTRGGHQRSVF